MPYKDSLAHWYDMSTPVGLPDLGKPGGNPGVGVNIASNPPGIGGGICAEMNGTTSVYNLGDVVELNSVSAFTLCWWMNQDILDQVDYIFRKSLDGTHRILILTMNDGDMWVRLNNGELTRAVFDYSLFITALHWHHVAFVYDGTQTGNANILVVYVDGTPVTLTFVGTLPATMADMSGTAATIGLAGPAFDGLLDSFGIFTAPLTQLQVADHRLATMQGRL